MFERYEKVDVSDPTVRDYTMLYERGCLQSEAEQVKKYLEKEKIQSNRLGNTYFLKLTNKQFDCIRRMRAVAGCGLVQKAYHA